MPTLKDCNPSDAVKRLNPDVFAVGAFRPKIAEQKPGRTLGCSRTSSEESRARLASNGPVLRISLVTYRRRLLDSDNHSGGCKPLRDAIAAYFQIDDADRFIEWEYGQQQSSGQQGTAVRIEVL